MATQTPKRLGRYQIEGEIGRGMMGVVYRARDPELNRTVALKTVSLAWATSEDDRGQFEKRFLNEARVAAGLSHPGIVIVHDVGRDPETGTLFIALEYLEGRTLAELTSGGATLDWREALRLTRLVADALQHAHEKGIVHRDVKPANIMVLPSGEPKIMDFGIAKVPASQLTSAGEFFGTPSYMSPEQAAAGALDGRSDLFSLGAVLYLLLTGKRAFDAGSVAAIIARVAQQDPPAPTTLAPGLPRDLDYLVRRALAKDPKDRYPDCRAFAEDIADIREDRPPRHRADWSEPRRAEGTMIADGLLQPVTEDLRLTAPTAPGREPTARVTPLWTDRRLLGAAVGLVAIVALLVLSRGRTTLPASTAAPAGVADEATPSPAATPGFSLPRLLGREEPARLDLTLEHPLKDGTLKVFVDDELVLERPLQARVTKKIVFYKKRKEVVQESLELAPGEHVVRVQVLGGDDSYSQRIRGQFKSGETRRLRASVGGVIGKDLELVWGS